MPSLAWRCVLHGAQPLLTGFARILEERGHELVAVVLPDSEAGAWTASCSIPAYTTTRAALGPGGTGTVDVLFSLAAVRDPEAASGGAKLVVHLIEGMPARDVGSGAPGGAISNDLVEHSFTWCMLTAEGGIGLALCEQRFQTAPDLSEASMEAKRTETLISGFADLLTRLEAAGGPALPDRRARLITRFGAHEDWWRQRLARVEAAPWPWPAPALAPAATTEAQRAGQDLQAEFDVSASPAGAAFAVAALLGLLARLLDKDALDIGYSDTPLLEPVAGLEQWFAAQWPLRAEPHFDQPLDALVLATRMSIAELHERGGYALDLLDRMTALRAGALGAGPGWLPIVVRVQPDLSGLAPEGRESLTVGITPDGRRCRWVFDPARVQSMAVAFMRTQWLALIDAAHHDPGCALGQLPLLGASIVRGAALAVPAVHGVHQLIEQQAMRTPQQPALNCAGRSLTYGELNSRANRLARHLVGKGVGPDKRVGVMLPRGIDMVVALLAIHKAGGAYVPLDPEYPAERLGHIAEDSGMVAVLALADQRARLPRCHAQPLLLDRERDAIERQSDTPFDGGAGPRNLAYVIYTSGSTGQPKGVQVEHGNVVNFFAGMSDLVPAGPSATWLAVTSLNFDISVLELLWTLSRGCQVVVAEAENLLAGGGAAPAPAQPRGLEFSLFYFSSDESALGSGKYQLLLDGARFADAHGFAAVWTPERHFHAFGGLYPNPAVTAAALATVTSHVQLRAGSVVAPLHHPIRIAEEWSVVDNLSDGRVGVSFASGWHPNDFVLNPPCHADAKGVMLRHIDTVRRLWRGERLVFEGPKGPVELGILPRPVQPELPFWVTSAGNVETFKDAGRVGANLLTHLLGQSLGELRPKIEAYRTARREAGHEGPGLVSLMVHAFVGPDAQEVRQSVREPLIAYLKSSLNLVKQYADSFPVFRRQRAEGRMDADLSKLSEADMQALLEHAFERYYETSGLFGTPQSCQPMLRAMADAGVDDVACLIDFGVEAQKVLHHLPYLARAKALATAGEAESLADLMRRHAVTHLQCTPSLARVLLSTEAGRSALRGLSAMLVGGEALPPTLARELRHALTHGRLLNMYGPTETTVWSTSQVVDDVDGTVPIGRPLANQSVYILDRRGQPVPQGYAGELVIGGDGVTRGYLGRPELTAERFVADRFSDRRGARMYRTGDLARIDDGGRLEFLGRLDDQVKIRGHRIELGEIEEALRAEPEVHDAAVAAPDGAGGDRVLVGYATPKAGRTLDATALRHALAQRLPAVMVPSRIVVLHALPRTPNGKLDRKALPRPESIAGPAGALDPEAAGPVTPMESTLAALWASLLGRPQVGIHEDFVGLGGHSLLAVQMQIKLSEELDLDVSIADIFRYPTIHRLAKRVQELQQHPMAEL